MELSTPCAYLPRVNEFRPFIYGLVDPAESKHVRYVGMAMKAKRPYQHALNARKESQHSHLFHWIRLLFSEGRAPEILVLEELPQGASRSFVGNVERMYISSLRSIGHRLTNVAAGGFGGNSGNNDNHSKESRLNAAEALRDYYKDPENQAVIAERNSRQAQTLRLLYAEQPERRQRISDAHKGTQTRLGAVLSDGAKQRLSDGMHRYYNDPENRNEIVERNARRAVTKASRPKVVMSAESNAARSKAHTGRPKSESHRAALSVAAKERERRKREVAS